MSIIAVEGIQRSHGVGNSHSASDHRCSTDSAETALYNELQSNKGEDSDRTTDCCFVSGISELYGTLSQNQIVGWRKSMTAKDAFDNIITRSERLLGLYDGMVNTRKRRIRKDWKSGFSKLMHWRQSISIERVDSRDAVVVLKESAQLTPQDFTHEGLDDLLRSALTFAVSALDRYVHERVVRKIVPALRTTKQNRDQKQLEIPAAVAIEIVDTVVRERRKNSNANIRPANIIRQRVQDLLHRKPFQSWKEVTYAFSLIGITGIDGAIQASLGLPNLRSFKTDLDHAIRKRNLVVHEGDLVRHARTGNAHARKNPIQPAEVRQAIDRVKTFVTELERIN